MILWLWLGAIVLLLFAIVPIFIKGRLKYHSLAIGGGALYLWSFFLLPWVSLGLLCLVGTLAGGLAPVFEFLGIGSDIVIALFGSEELQTLWESGTVVGHFAFNPSGALLTLYYPINEIDWYFLTLLWLPAIYAFIVVAAGILSMFPIFPTFQRFFSGLLFFVGLFVIFPLLLSGLPLIDSWGTSGEFVPGLAAWILNADMGFGAWLAALVALPMMIISTERIYAGLQANAGDYSDQYDTSNSIAELIFAVPGKVWTIIASVLFIVSFFFLPWIQYDTDAYQVNLANLNNLAPALSTPLCALNGLASGCALYEAPWPFIDDQVQAIQSNISNGRTISGLSMAIRPFSSNAVMQFALISSVLLVVFNLVWAIVALIQQEDNPDRPFNRFITSLTMPLALVCGVLLFLHYPDIEVFATAQHYQLALLMTTALAKVGYGAGIAVVAIFLLALGAFRELMEFFSEESLKPVVLSIIFGVLIAVVSFITMGVLRITATCELQGIEPSAAIATPFATATTTSSFPPTAFQVAENASSVNLCPGGQARMNWPVSLPPTVQQTDILLAFDLSASMDETILEARENAVQLMQAISNSLENVHFGVIGFADELEYPYELFQPITNDFTILDDSLNQMRQQAGSADEAYLRVMYESYSDSNIGWRLNSRRFLVFFADEHLRNTEPGRDGRSGTSDDLIQANVINQLTDQNIIMVVFGPQQSVVSSWSTYVHQTGGQAVLLSNDGQMGSLVNDVIMAISRTIASLDIDVEPIEFDRWVTTSSYTDIEVGLEEQILQMDLLLQVEDGFHNSGNYDLTISAVGDGIAFASRTLRVIIPTDCPKPPS